MEIRREIHFVYTFAVFSNRNRYRDVVHMITFVVRADLGCVCRYPSLATFCDYRLDHDNFARIVEFWTMLNNAIGNK